MSWGIGECRALGRNAKSDPSGSSLFLLHTYELTISNLVVIFDKVYESLPTCGYNRFDLVGVDMLVVWVGWGGGSLRVNTLYEVGQV